MPKRHPGDFHGFARRATQTCGPIVEPNREVDLCLVDPGFDVDLYLSTDLRTMTKIWMGYTTIGQAKEQGSFIVTGNK